VLAQAACQVTYTGESGTKTDSLTAGDMASYVWMDTYWKYQSVPVTGIDDNGQPFAYNNDSMVEACGVINITGTDADGNPFDYGLGRLVTNADEDNYSTSEVKTTKTWIDGKPIYCKVIEETTTAGTSTISISSLNIDTIVRTNIQCIVANGDVILTPYFSAASTDYFNAYASADKSTITVRSGSSYSHGTVVIILEYTKTTD
jgi:hypothetical protein